MYQVLLLQAAVHGQRRDAHPTCTALQRHRSEVDAIIGEAPGACLIVGSCHACIIFVVIDQRYNFFGKYGTVRWKKYAIILKKEDVSKWAHPLCLSLFPKVPRFRVYGLNPKILEN